MTVDIPFARKVLEFVEADHGDEFVHNQKAFFMNREVARHIAGHGDLTTTESTLVYYELPADFCGTSACIAGTACLLDPDTEIASDGQSVNVHGEEGRGFEERAIELLGLSTASAYDLFFTFNNERAIKKLREHIEAAEREQFSGT